MENADIKAVGTIATTLASTNLGTITVATLKHRHLEF